MYMLCGLGLITNLHSIFIIQVIQNFKNQKNLLFTFCFCYFTFLPFAVQLSLHFGVFVLPFPHLGTPSLALVSAGASQGFV